MKGFEQITNTPKRANLSTGLIRRPKVGGTTFGLTGGHEKAYILDLNKGCDGVVNKWTDEIEIYIKSYDTKDIRATTKAEAEEIVEKVNEDYYNGLEELSGTNSVVIVDTATEYTKFMKKWKWNSMGLPKNLAHKYGEVYLPMENFYKAALDYDVDVIFVHEAKDGYANDKPTGEDVADAYNKMEHLVEVVAHLHQENDKDDGLLWYTEIRECRKQGHLKGSFIQNVYNYDNPNAMFVEEGGLAELKTIVLG